MKKHSIPILAIGLLLASCGGGSSPPPPLAACTVTGVTAGIGSSNGGCCYILAVGSGHAIQFDNIALNLSPDSYEGGLISDVGSVGCLESITTWTGLAHASSAAYTSGHGYIIQFPQTVSANGTVTGPPTYVRFIALGYSGGVARLTYDYPFSAL